MQSHRDQPSAAPIPEHHVSCQMRLDVHGVAETALQVCAALSSGSITDEHLLVDDAPLAGHRELIDSHNGRIQLVELAAGRRTLQYTCTVRHLPPGDRRGNDATDLDRLVYLRPSRFCPSDRLGGFASSEFGYIGFTQDRAEAISCWIHDRISYVLGSGSGHDSAEDTLLMGRGSCRDFAHLGVALCRALGIPARFVAAYAPGLSPMDFHAVFESFSDGRWLVHDPTGLAPRQTLLRIATGRDASDTAFFSVFPDVVELLELSVMAVVEGDLPADDYRVPVELA